MFRDYRWMLLNSFRGAKGFTLIELLVVIAIIAVLAVVVILTLNPAELLRQARDSNRVSDLGTLKSVLSLYLADVNVTGTVAIGTYGQLYVNNKADTNTSTYDIYDPRSMPPQAWGFASTSATSFAATSSATQRNVDGTGWIPANLKAISSGSPIGNLPVDPVNNASNTYAYVASSTVFKMATKMESSKYGNGGGADVVSTDGGNSSSTFEAGTKFSL